MVKVNPRVSCPHPGGMVPINGNDILHLFRYVQESYQFQLYRLGDFPQLFARCCLCNAEYIAPPEYEPITWADAIEWATGDDNG